MARPFKAGGFGKIDLENYNHPSDYILLFSTSGEMKLFLFKSDRNIILYGNELRGRDINAIFDKRFGLELDTKKFNQYKFHGIKFEARLFEMAKKWILNRDFGNREFFFDGSDVNVFDDDIIQSIQSSMDWPKLLGVMYQLNRDGFGKKDNSFNMIKSYVSEVAVQVASGGRFSKVNGVGYDHLFNSKVKMELKVSKKFKFTKDDFLTVQIKHDGANTDVRTYKPEAEYYFFMSDNEAFIMPTSDLSKLKYHKADDDSDMCVTVRKRDLHKFDMCYNQVALNPVSFTQEFYPLIQNYISDFKRI